MCSVLRFVPFLGAFIIAATLAHAAEYHVAPAGTRQGNGSATEPWDLQTALSGAPDREGKRRIAAGDTVWLHGGTYRGGVKCELSGSREAPIIVRQAAGERATIDCRPRDDRDDGLFAVLGDDVEFHGFEVTCSDPRRETKEAGSWPADIRRGGLFCRGSRVRFVNLVIHDTANGIGFWSEGEGGEVSGCLIFHNGWFGPDRAHGHAIYAQNRLATKRFVDNIVFEQFGYGIHCYGSEKAHLQGFHIEGNVAFDNGALRNPEDPAPAILVGGGTPVDRVNIVDNFTWNGGISVGYAWGVPNLGATVRNNRIVGRLFVRDFATMHITDNVIVQENGLVRHELTDPDSPRQWVWSDNRYHRPGGRWPAFELMKGKQQQGLDFAGWKSGTGYDHGSQFHAARPVANEIFVRPNPDEKGRGHIIVYNWTRSEAVDVDLSSIVPPGGHYRIQNARDYFGPPVLAGVFDGKQVRVEMKPRTPVQPVGLPELRLPAMEPDFGAYVVLSE